MTNFMFVSVRLLVWRDNMTIQWTFPFKSFGRERSEVKGKGERKRGKRKERKGFECYFSVGLAWLSSLIVPKCSYGSGYGCGSSLSSLIWGSVDTSTASLPVANLEICAISTSFWTPLVSWGCLCMSRFISLLLIRDENRPQTRVMRVALDALLIRLLDRFLSTALRSFFRCRLKM